MFEIIMLFAFLWAATSQLPDSKHAKNSQRTQKLDNSKEDQNAPLSQPAAISGKPRVNVKRRNRDYASAA